jgi:hypothetical protein
MKILPLVKAVYEAREIKPVGSYSELFKVSRLRIMDFTSWPKPHIYFVDGKWVTTYYQARRMVAYNVWLDNMNIYQAAQRAHNFCVHQNLRAIK